MKNLAGVALLTAFLIAPICRGQQNPDFSGTWKLDVAHSDYGDLQGPSSRTDIIEHHNGEITERVMTTQKHKSQNYILHFSTDGRKTVFPAGAEIHIPPIRLLAISSTWKNNTLVVNESLGFDDYKIPARYLYDLSSDGSRLTMTLFLGEATPAATFVFERVRNTTSRLQGSPDSRDAMNSH